MKRATVVGVTNVVTFRYRGPGIVGWWRGESNALDSAISNHGYLTNGATYNASGKVNSAFAVSGANQFVAIPQTASLNITGRVSIEFWVNAYTNNAMNSFQGLVTSDNYLVSIDVGNPNLGVYGLDLSINDNGTFYDTANINGGGPRITAGVWHHVVGVYDGSKLQLYVDGLAVGNAQTHSGSIKPMTAGHYVTLGAENGRGVAGRNFAGLIDEASVYNRNLSASEIKAIYQAGVAGKFDPLTSAPLNLAKARLTLSGVQTNTLFGINLTWQTATTTFVASTNVTVMQLDGLQPGLLLDSVTLTSSLATTNIIATTNIVPTSVLGYAQWTNGAGANGHWYRAFTNSASSPLNWVQADQVATNAGGYLATITSSNENTFVFNLINNPIYFQGAGGNGAGPAIGGVQTNGAAEPAGGWTWETGEPWSYTSWNVGQGQPDNGFNFVSQVEDRAHYWSGTQGVPANLWNDLPSTDSNLGGYVIERNTATNIVVTNTINTTTNIVATTNRYSTTNVFVLLNNAVTNFTSTFDAATAGDYVAASAVDGWSVTNNQVSVVNDAATAQAGSQFLALGNGSIRTLLPTVAGATNLLTFQYRGPGAVSMWRGEAFL